MNFNFIKKDGLFLRLIEAIIDIGLVNLGFYLAFQLRFDFQPLPININPFYNILPYISLLSLVVFISLRLFTDLRKSLIDIIFKVSVSLVMINITTAGIAFFARGFKFPRSIFIISFLIQLIIISVFKGILVKILRKSYERKKILIVGNKEDTENIAKKLIVDKINMDNIKYMCNSFGEKVFSLIDEVDKIYVGSSVNNDLKSEIISYCIGKNKIVYLVPEIFEIAMLNAKTDQLDDTLVFEVDNFHLSMESRIFKRIFDIIFSSVCLILTSPILIIVAIIIKLYDQGPVLFKQERITQGNSKFKLYKFRTMIVDAEKKTGPILAAEKDPRITPLGKFLRTTRLDELPQLFNVFRGDMSVVGPRPERDHFISQFTKDIPHFKYRVVVKAGITGLAQVLGKYTTSPDDKVRYDLLYIRNYSFWLDMRIIMQTIKVIFIKESSSGVREQKPLEEIFSERNIRTAYDETSVTKIENY